MTSPDLTWHTIAQMVVRVTRGDRLLGVVVQGEQGQWTVMALEGPTEAVTGKLLPKRVQALFDNHAHKMVGVFKTPSDAMVVAESYANAWFYQDAETMARCCCRDIRDAGETSRAARAAAPARKLRAVASPASRRSARRPS